jgi:C1A family cysteine protease
MTRTIPGMGWKPDIPDHRDRYFHLDERVLMAEALPVKLSLRQEMPPVYDQGQLGSCTANGIAAVLEHAAMREKEAEVTPSRLFIYYGERELEGTIDEDAGAEIRDGIKVVASKGAPPESDWPYDIGRFTEKPPPQAYSDALEHEAIEYKRVEPLGRGAPIRTALSMHLPIVAGFPVPEKFEDGTWNPATQALPVPSSGEGFIGGHCVVATGFDYTRQRFPVNVIEWRNSWSDGWGDHGYFYTDAAWLAPGHSLFSDLWVIQRVK